MTELLPVEQEMCKATCPRCAGVVWGGRPGLCNPWRPQGKGAASKSGVSRPAALGEHGLFSYSTPRAPPLTFSWSKNKNQLLGRVGEGSVAGEPGSQLNAWYQLFRKCFS